MVSKTNICNISLRRLGCEPISSLSDNNKRAKVYNDLYDITRRDVLEAFPWPFAKGRVKLTAVVTPAVPFGFSNEFTLPNDYIIAIKEFKGVEYLREGNFLLSDATELSLIYTKNIIDEDLFTPLFTKVFYLTLAIEASYAMTNDIKLIKYNSLLNSKR